MPKHKPIRFADPKLSSEVKNDLASYLKQHPIAVNTAKVILATALLGGLLTTLAVAPGLGLLAGKAMRSMHKERKERYRKLWERFYVFRRRKLIEFVHENEDGELVYRFTDNGRREGKKFLLETLEIKPPKKWDGLWRIVVFDIPEKLKRQRNTLQSKLRGLGFYQLQRSVLIHPFPCEFEVEFLNDFLDIDKYVELFTTRDMPTSRAIRYFKGILSDYI